MMKVTTVVVTTVKTTVKMTTAHVTTAALVSTAVAAMLSVRGHRRQTERNHNRTRPQRTLRGDHGVILLPFVARAHGRIISRSHGSIGTVIA
jgi:membrane protein implicated in regulation of membrane protease activity